MHEAREFLNELFGRKPKAAKIVLWTKSDKRSHYFDGVPEAGKFAREARVDVYTHVSLANKNHGQSSRIKAGQSAGIPGLWADIDVNGGPEEKTNAAPTLEAAAELAGSILQPTLIVNSGYGLQAWWLLDEPWCFASVEERAQAQQMAAAWIRLLRTGAAERGFNIDATQDLARLMRVPGTINGKGGLEAECTGWPDPIDQQDGPRYTVEELGELAASAPRPAASEPGSNVQMELRSDASPPFDKFSAAMANDELFEQTWNHDRRGAAANWTMSEHDMSLASQAAAFDWTDQEIADLLVAHRRRFGDPQGKATRQDYIQRTIAKARSEQVRTRRAGEREQALERLEEVADGEVDPDRDHTCAVFSEAVGYPIKELVQDGRDPRTVRYTIILPNGEEVPVGGGDALLNQSKFTEAMMAVTGHVMEPIKPVRWRKAISALMKTKRLRESDDDTQAGQAIEWLRSYMTERAPKQNLEADEAAEAAKGREPFMRDDLIHVFAGAFSTYVRTALRVNITDADVKAMLRAAGFERLTYGYRLHNQPAKTASYYAAPKDVLE
jgi:hypothetical protein